MLGVRVPKGKAEGLKKYLQKNGILDSKYRVFSGNSFIYFPLSGDAGDTVERRAGKFEAKLVEREFVPTVEKMLKSASQVEGAARGYDLYGNMAVVDGEPAAAKKMAGMLMDANKNIKTVLRKGGAVSGRYRTRKFIHVLGKRNYVADYRENGCEFRFDIRKAFFSTRLAFERKRISDLVKDGENVVVMFAGVGPYAIEIAKRCRKSRVVAIELNAAACKYMRGNIALNKTGNVVCEQGDVSRFSRKYAGFADRIVMPLPKDAFDFLKVAVRMAGRRCTIHLYLFCPNDKVDETIKMTKDFLARNGARTVGISHRIVRPYSSRETEIVLDIRVSLKKA